MRHYYLTMKIKTANGLKEMTGLYNLKTFEFHPPNFKLGKDYQFAPLHMIFDIKNEDLRHKARLVISGHIVDSSMYNSYQAVIQTMTIRMLMTIALSEDLKVITGDIGNAYVHAECGEKIYS